MKTAFVTGGTGFLGFNLVKQLLGDDWQVIALHRSSSDLSDLKPLNVRLVEGDLRDPGSLAKIMPTGVDASYLEVAQRIGKLLHRRVPRRPLSRRLLMVLSYLSLGGSYVTRSEPDITPEKVRLLSGDLRCRSDKAVRELGYRPASLEKMIRDSYRWLTSTGRLG